MEYNTPAEDRDIFIEDKRKRKYHFKIYSYLAPNGIELEAVEVKEDGTPGKSYSILTDYDTEFETAKGYLARNIKYEIDKRHCPGRNPKPAIGAKSTIKGRIEGDSVVVDGRKVPPEMLFNRWDGWNFEIKILDKYSEEMNKFF